MIKNLKKVFLNFLREFVKFNKMFVDLKLFIFDL